MWHHYGADSAPRPVSGSCLRSTYVYFASVVLPETTNELRNSSVKQKLNPSLQTKLPRAQRDAFTPAQWAIADLP